MAAVVIASVLLAPTGAQRYALGDHARIFERVSLLGQHQTSAIQSRSDGPAKLSSVADLAMCTGLLWEVDPKSAMIIGVDPTSGGLRHFVAGSSIGVEQPARLACVGSKLWIAGNGATVAVVSTETGSLIRKVILPGVTGADPIGGLLTVGGTVWADDSFNRVIDVVDATSWISTRISNAIGTIDGPARMATDGINVWVAGGTGNALASSIATVNVAAGAVTAIRSNPNGGWRTTLSDSLAYPVGLAVSGGGVWAANFANSSVSEFSSTDGSLLGSVPQSFAGFDEPSAIVASPTTVWVANANSNVLIALDAMTRTVTQRVTLPSSSPVLVDAMVLVGSQLFAASFTTGTVFAVDSLSGQVHVLSEEQSISGPSALATGATTVWVVNSTSDTVVGLSQKTGLPKVFLDLRDVANGPLTGIADDGRHLWITVSHSGQVIEATLTGSLVRTVVSGALTSSTGVFADGSHVWVSEPASNAVVEINASNGTVQSVLAGSSYGFAMPRSIVGDGVHIWVANIASSSVTELSEATGAVVVVRTGLGIGFGQPISLVSDGAHVWVAGTGGVFTRAAEKLSAASIVEFAASTGALLSRINFAGSTWSMPTSIALVHGHLWICDLNLRTVEAYNTSGARVASYQARNLGLIAPMMIVSDATHVWVGDPQVSHLAEAIG